ncbi:43741_t:CDS:1, partial [Gigaspora margarita]
IITNWLELLKDKQYKKDLDFENLNEIVYSATSQNTKWSLLQIFQDNLLF